MQAANTLEVRKAINGAFYKLGKKPGRTWTDPVVWSDYGGPERVVTYATVYAEKIAAEANKTLRAAGFNNEVRVTDNDRKLPNGSWGTGPYVKVNADLS